MAQDSDLLSLLLVFLMVLLGALLGAFIAFFLFRITLGRRVNRIAWELRGSMEKLYYGLESLTRSVQRQTSMIREQVKTGVSGSTGTSDRGTVGNAARPPASGNGLRVPDGLAGADAFRHRSDTRADSPKSLQQWLQILSANPDAFQEQADAKAVSVRKTGSGPSAASAVYEHPNGRFWLFTADGRDWVIPKAGLRIDDTSFYDTGIRDLFECPGYESHRAFAFKVIRAASVSRAGDSWTLAERGRLELRAEAGA